MGITSPWDQGHNRLPLLEVVLLQWVLKGSL